MDLAGVTEETLNQMREPMLKAITTTGYQVGTGLYGYPLERPAKLLAPVRSPWRNRLSRVMAETGGAVAHWKAITALNVGNASPFMGYGAAGASVQTTETDYAVAYAPIGLGDTVQMDAQVIARGFDDLRARSGINLLFATMIAEDRMLLGAQNFTLQTPGTPTVTLATTGGTIANATAVHFVVAVRTVEGYYFAMSNAAGTAAGTAAGGGTVTSVDGALPGADATNPTTGLPGLAAARAGGGLNIRTGGAAFVDTSADANAFPGLLGTMCGDIATSGLAVTRGSGTNSGAVFSDLAGAKITGSQGTVSEIDSVLLTMFNTSGISPTRMLMSAQQHLDVSSAMVKTGTYNTFLQGADMEYRQAATGGIFLTKYINKAANGFPVEMETMPNLPPGIIILVTEVLPFPDNQVSQVFAVETQQEYTQIEYAMSRATGTSGGPRYDIEVRAIECLRAQFPAGCAAVTGIGNGIN